MFEEGQLYSPVSADTDGRVTVHLADDHPGAGDPDYQARRNDIAALAIMLVGVQTSTVVATHRYSGLSSRDTRSTGRCSTAGRR